MKRFEPVPEPEGWQECCVQPGRAWLAEHPGAPRPRDYWTGEGQCFRRHLREGFHGLCAYTSMWVPNGTTDHYVPWARLRGTECEHRAYEWENLRYADTWFNTSRRATDIPDPYAVHDDWFELLIPSMELVATPSVPETARAQVANVLRWLGNDPRVVDVRLAWFEMYRRGDLAFAALEAKAPLIARALLQNPSFLLPR